MSILNTIVSLISFSLIIIIFYTIRSLDEDMNNGFSHLENLFISGESSTDSVDELLKRYEVERDAEFDKKIEDMKVELYGTSADILIKGVKNIEHEDVDKELLKLKEIKEEYAE